MNKLSNNKPLNFIAALSFFGLLAFGIALMYPGRADFDITRVLDYHQVIIDGWILTIIASIIVLFLSVILGFFLYILTNTKILVFRYIGLIFGEVVFGSPLVVFLIVIYYFIGVPLHLNNRFVVGIIGLSMYMAPYMKNILQGAMESIEDIQYQAMTVFGFTTYQKYRYIILPQLLKILMPPLAGNLTFIVKGSSLLNFIGVSELYNQISTVQARTYAFAEGYLIMFVMYLAITLPLIRLTTYFERRVATWN